MAVKVIVEQQAKPGKRAGLKSLMESIVAKEVMSQPGFLGSTRYEVIGNPVLHRLAASILGAQLKSGARMS